MTDVIFLNDRATDNFFFCGIFLSERGGGGVFEYLIIDSMKNSNIIEEFSNKTKFLRGRRIFRQKIPRKQGFFLVPE